MMDDDATEPSTTSRRALLGDVLPLQSPRSFRVSSISMPRSAGAEMQASPDTPRSIVSVRSSLHRSRSEKRAAGVDGASRRKNISGYVSFIHAV